VCSRSDEAGTAVDRHHAMKVGVGVRDRLEAVVEEAGIGSVSVVWQEPSTTW
jgi:hypothetical protein